MNMLSTKLSSLEKFALYVIVGISTIIFITFFSELSSKLGPIYYFILLPIKFGILFLMLSKINRYKDVSFDTTDLLVESMFGVKRIPLKNIESVTYFLRSKCIIRFVENRRRKSVSFLRSKIFAIFDEEEFKSDLKKLLKAIEEAKAN